MKKQLLEDFGDSASAPVGARPAVAHEAQPAPAPKVWRARATPPRPVWRARAASPAPSDDPPALTEHARPPMQTAQAPSATAAPPPPPLPPSSEPSSFANERFYFSADEPVIAMDFPATAPRWSERWGRRLLGALAGVALLVAAAGAGWWMVQEHQVVTTLALVADQSPPPAREGWRAPDRDAAAPPAMVLLPAEPVPEPQPEAAPESAPEPALPVALAQDDSEGVLTDNGEQAANAAAEAVRRAEARRLAARQAAAKKDAAKEADRQAARKEAARQATARERASKDAERKEATRQAAARAAAAAEPAAQQAETLRQCRAAGYHASQCVKRGCVATRFGLACRG